MQTPLTLLALTFFVGSHRPTAHLSSGSRAYLLFSPGPESKPDCMRPVRSEQWATSLVFDVPAESELCDEDFTPHPARRTALLQNPSACADVCALHLRAHNRWMQIYAASLMQHLARFPFAQTVELTNIGLHASIQSASDHPICASLSELVIRVWRKRDSSGALLGMLPCLPGLRILKLSGGWPSDAGDIAIGDLSSLHLECFSCSGIITVSACARIIACSAHTLRDLRVTKLEGHPNTPELTQLAQALVDSAPGLREFELSLPDCGAFAPSRDALCANLARVCTVTFRCTTHFPLWDLARRLCPAFRGHLKLVRLRSSPVLMQMSRPAWPIADAGFLAALASARFRSLTVHRDPIGIDWDLADQLAELCRERRIQLRPALIRKRD